MSTKLRRRLFAPEVVQTSATDCGPACLVSLLEGHGVRASYGRVREACRTDVDGSSIDTIEQIAVDLGLAARQVMVPKEHLGLKGLLPAIVVVRQPNGMTHFVVAWRLHPGCVQIMDPATGRRWSSSEQFLDEVYTHELEIPVDAWCQWAASDDFLLGVGQRLRQLGLSRAQVHDALAPCRAAVSWRPAAALDAAARFVAALVREGALRPGRETRTALLSLCERASDEAVEPTAVIPAEFWTARRSVHGSDLEPRNTVQLRGAVLVSIGGDAVQPDNAEAPVRRRPLAPDLVLALAEPRARPARELASMLFADGLLAPGLLIALLAFAAGGVLVEALLFRALFAIGGDLAVAEQRLAGICMLLAFVLLLLALEGPIWSRTLALGRQLECRLRLRLLEKLAAVHDRYFQSRLVSDMAERCHRLHELRLVPELGAELLRAVFGMVLTTGGIVWLEPGVAVIVLVGASICIAVPWLAQPLLAEGDLRLRNHSGAILRFHLDALLGVVPLRAHAAGRALRGEHGKLVAKWSSAGLRLQRRVVAIEAVMSVVGLALAALLLFVHSSRAPSGAGALLMVYWALSLPVFGQQIGLCARRYPNLRSTTLRCLELLGTPDAKHTPRRTDAVPVQPPNGPGHGVAARRDGGTSIRIANVSVVAAGHTILDGIDLTIEAGSHVAIVGPSGAGKSTLAGLLLGWHEPASGRVFVDGELLDGATLAQLRRETAWVDPSVQLWNRSLLDNLFYGAEGAPAVAVGATIERTGVSHLIDGLPDGLQSALGEGGALVSGGEGQRVRLARGALRSGARLVVLDEPFRGLSREVRTDLLAYAREIWRGATLLCVTHDIQATLGFDRVLVIEGGQVVADGAPKALAEVPSRYRDCLDAERQVHADAWSDRIWRRLRLERGRLRHAAPDPVA